MPRNPKRPCCAPGCATLTDGGRCPVHQRKLYEERGTTKERGYDSAWKRIRLVKLANDPICEIQTHCNGAPATEVDHKKTIQEAPELRLAMWNLQSACKSCNSAKAQRKKVLLHSTFWKK